MSTYKLYYFPVKGRAEAIRLLFAYKGIKYEDIRIGGEKWAEFKPATPFGSMPVLEEDGKMLGGSFIILRYLGEKEGLAGTNAWENAQIANIADFVSDFHKEVVSYYFEKDEAKKKALAEKMEKETGPKFLGKFEELAKANDGYLFGKCFTWADLTFFCLFEGLVVKYFPTLTDKYPNLGKFKTNIESIPNIAKWLAERPDTAI